MAEAPDVFFELARNMAEKGEHFDLIVDGVGVLQPKEVHDYGDGGLWVVTTARADEVYYFSGELVKAVRSSDGSDEAA